MCIQISLSLGRLRSPNQEVGFVFEIDFSTPGCLLRNYHIMSQLAQGRARSQRAKRDHSRVYQSQGPKDLNRPKVVPGTRRPEATDWLQPIWGI